MYYSYSRVLRERMKDMSRCENTYNITMFKVLRGKVNGYVLRSVFEIQS